MITETIILVALGMVGVLARPAFAAGDDWPQYGKSPFVIELDIPPFKKGDSAGSMIAADVTGDTRPDFLITVPGHVAAYDNAGGKLWVRRIDVQVGGSSERVGLPGHHGPGLAAGDVDADGKVEVLFLTRDGKLHALDGATGQDKWTAQPPFPDDAERWEHLVIANFRGDGDRDLLLQATNRKGYRVGRYLAAYAVEDLAAGRYTPLWQRDDFVGCAHNGARVADLDGDGRDEVLGATLLGPDGQTTCRLPNKGHVDSVFVYDVVPESPGLEVVYLEEGGGNRVFCCSKTKVLWETHLRHTEPQNAAIGRFDPQRPGLQVWCRSRYNQHQKPFVFDAAGKLIGEYELDKVKPAGWTDSGVEVIWAIDWTGADAQLAAAKERHTSGDVCVFEPITGRFVEHFPNKADRIYVADVSGDWREEILVLSGNRLFIYHNPRPNPHPDRPRLWTQPHYCRSKRTWNYYSP